MGAGSPFTAGGIESFEVLGDDIMDSDVMTLNHLELTTEDKIVLEINCYNGLHL